MSDFVVLTCPSCGSRLQVTNDMERFACGHCGNELVVKRGGGIVALAPVVAGLHRVETAVTGVGVGVDRTAAELAVQRLTRDLELLQHQWNQVDAEKIGSMLGWGLGLILLGWIAIANDTVGIGLGIAGVGAAALVLFFVAQQSKNTRKNNLGSQIAQVERQIQHQLKKLG